MITNPNSATPTTTQRPSSAPNLPPDSPIPWWLLAAGCVTFILSAMAGVSPTIAFVSLALMASLILGWWAAASGDALVVAVALLVFWAPFHTSFSRLNLGPQEIGVYLTIIACVVLDRRGAWAWLGSFIRPLPLIGLISVGVFALACLQGAVFDHSIALLDRIQAFRSEFLYPVLFGLLIAYTVFTRKVERVLIRAFFAGSVALALYALTLKLWGVDIANGAVVGRLGAEVSFLSQYHPNNIGLYFAFALPFALPLWHEASEAWAYARLRKALILVCVFLLSLDIFLAASRGTLVALACSALVALVILLWLGTTSQRVVAGSIALGGGIAVGLLVLLGKTQAFGRYAALLNPKTLLANPNVTFRLNLYARAWSLIKSHPLTGVGLDAFNSSALAPYSPHDTYLNVWVSMGIFGLIAFVLPLFLAVFYMFRWAAYHRRVKDQAGLFYCIGIILAIAAFLTQAFTESFDAQPRIAPIVWFFALIGMVASFRPALEQLPRTSKPMRSPTRGPRLTPLIAPPPADWSGRIEDLADVVAIPTEATAENTSGSALATTTAPLTPPLTPPPPYATHPPLPAPQTPAAVRQTGAPALPDTLPTDDESENDLDPDWAWMYNTGPMLMTAQNTLPLIDNGTFASSGVMDVIALQREVSAQRAAVNASGARHEAEALLRRAPASFVWNQMYSLLIFALSFVLSVVIARGLSASDFGVYTMLSTLTSVLLLLFAFGLEDAASVYVPRLLALGGAQGASSLLRRMLALRTGVMLFIALAMAGLIPLLNGALTALGGAPAQFAHALIGSAGWRAALLGAYLAGSGVIALQGSFFASVLKTRATLVIGGVTQTFGVILTLALMQMGYGLDGVFGAQAIAAWVAAIAYLIILLPYLRGRTPAGALDSKGVRSLMVSAWLTNVSNGALGKQMDIVLMSLFAVSYALIGFYNLAYQLVSVVGVLLISGLGGVSVAAMSVAFTAHGRERLIALWRAMIMLQLALVIPFQVATFALANQIIVTIYGPTYAPAATLLRIFLVFSFLGRILGGGANQSALYVISKQRIVLITRGIGFALNLILDVILIRLAGPAGALFATGFSQLWVGVVEYFVLRREIKTRYPTDMAVRVLTYSLVAAIPAVGLAGWAESAASAVTGSLIIAFPVVASLSATVAGLLELVLLGLIFGVVFIAAALLLGLGNVSDIVDQASVNPRAKWLFEVISRSKR